PRRGDTEPEPAAERPRRGCERVARVDLRACRARIANDETPSQVGLVVDAVGAELAIERLRADAEQLRGSAAMPAHLLEDRKDLLLLDVFEAGHALRSDDG